MPILTDPGKAPIKGKAPTKLEARAARMGAWAKPAVVIVEALPGDWYTVPV